MNINAHVAVADHASYLSALACAEQRSLHSFFDQHIIEDQPGIYIAIDEGDYQALPPALIDKLVFTVPGAMHDDY